METDDDSAFADDLPNGWRNLAADWATQKDRIHELYLFGSRAKGTFEQQSDVGIAYVLTGGDPGEVLAYSMYDAQDWEGELQELFSVTVQLEMADPQTDSVVWPAVVEHGQLIYRKSSYLPVRQKPQP